MLFQNVYKNKKVLVTGDTGFKGSWLALWLKELGAEVYGFALPPQRTHDNFVTTDLTMLIHHQDGDVRDFDAFSRFAQSVQPDIAFHLAAQPIVLESYQNPKYTFETNILGTVNFFEIIRSLASVKAAVNITSDKCYQNNEWVWGYREQDPMGGKDPYSASKGCAELVTASYRHSFFSTGDTCAVASARAGNVIGGGDWADKRIVPDFFRALQQGQPIELRNPHATRPWQFVLEPLSGYLQLGAQLFLEGKEFSGGWNFGPGDALEHTVQDIIESMIQKTGRGKLQIENQTHKLHEATLLRLDISKAMTFLHWRPVLTYDELIDFTAEGYQVDLSGGDVLTSRKEQLQKYMRLAYERNVAWAVNGK
jgi:CDP-glucose 4,6-dehydratase